MHGKDGHDAETNETKLDTRHSILDLELPNQRTDQPTNFVSGTPRPHAPLIRATKSTLRLQIKALLLAVVVRRPSAEKAYAQGGGGGNMTALLG